MTQTVTSGRRRASADSRQHRGSAPSGPILTVRAAPVSALRVDERADRGSQLPSRRSLRAARVERSTGAGQPGRTERSRQSGTARRAASDRATTDHAASRTALRRSAPAAGLLLASAGLIIATVAPSTGTAPTSPAAVDLVSDLSAPAVTASAGAAVTFGLERAGSAVDGIAPSVVSARALTGSASPTAREREAFTTPVGGAELVSTFGHRVDPMGGSGSDLHTGVDYATDCGTPVTAADAGTVTESGWHAYGGGQRIVVDHGDGMRTTYNHLSALGVVAGQSVARGEQIGAVGSTGNSTGCHLHFEVMVGEEKVDPQPWL